MVHDAYSELSVAALDFTNLTCKLLLPLKGKPVPDLPAEDIVPGGAVLPVAEPFLDSGVKHLLPDYAALREERILLYLPERRSPERQVEL